MHVRHSHWVFMFIPRRLRGNGGFSSAMFFCDILVFSMTRERGTNVLQNSLVGHQDLVWLVLERVLGSFSWLTVLPTKLPIIALDG